MCYYFFAGTVQNHITSHYISTTVQHSYSLYIHVMFRFAIVLRENHIDDKYCPVCYRQLYPIWGTLEMWYYFSAGNVQNLYDFFKHFYHRATQLQSIIHIHNIFVGFIQNMVVLKSNKMFSSPCDNQTSYLVPMG